ncbi:coiled-coil domain-containing protein [Histomonas meleagridis]|uniref:coiled-coil domain-containing protein n=1 Tax=Histomonas meleagridis TaxID=135588 RepID=UPI0035599B37|nr:coiled-coil domain-containing protein [Histomonas meleagridis]KAH0801492.1 coiled-coil domain-containing protein [Histomonas meleagridis]
MSEEMKTLNQLILSPDSNQVQEGIQDFIQQKREIFLSQLAIDTKLQELERLDQIERNEEEHLKAKEAEIKLFRDQFNAFLENDSKATMEARQAAEIKSKQCIEVSMQIKQISSQISALRSEIAHSDEKLQECQSYKAFLESLTPASWRKEHPFPEMYFKDPQQLLTILKSLEEQNMFLIRHCQEAEEAVERCRQQFNALLESRDESITAMMDAKSNKEKELTEIKERNEQYKVNNEFSHGNEINEDQLHELQRSITEFHSELGFDASSINDTVTMLRRIEEKMEEITKKLSSVDPMVLKKYAQEKEKIRRNQERTEKNIRDKEEQEMKAKRAIELAMKPIKRRNGRPLLERTMPKRQQSREKREERMKQKVAQQKADEELLYGMIWD